MTGLNGTSFEKIVIYANSQHTGQLPGGETVSCFLARETPGGRRLLGVRLEDASNPPFAELLAETEEVRYYALNARNAALLRQVFSWLNPTALESESTAGPSRPRSRSGKPSFGFGDRLGLATPGHIRALRSVGAPGSIAPIFAQQSVRENSRTGRTPQGVVDEAMWNVFQEGWQLPWGADADHLKLASDLPAFVEAGYSCFTIDPGEHVDSAADSDPIDRLKEKVSVQDWTELDEKPANPAEIAAAYHLFCNQAGLHCTKSHLIEKVLRAMVKYGRAVLHIAKMYRALLALKPAGFDFEASVDETETPTTALEHFYIAGELKRLGVRVTSLAPRLPGGFEKGVDYIGDLKALEAELVRHAAVMEYYGSYKFSLHSGSDKFSLYPLLVRHTGAALHVKTAGTSYLEALRVASHMEPALFRQVLDLARERYPQDRQSYMVSARVECLPDSASVADEALPALLDDFHVREALHVTFGSALSRYGSEIRGLLIAQPEAYEQVLLAHFKRHLEPLVD